MSEVSVKEATELLRRVKKAIRPPVRKYPPESEKIGLSRRGRKRKYQSKAEKQRAYRERKKLTDILSIS